MCCSTSNRSFHHACMHMPVAHCGCGCGQREPRSRYLENYRDNLKAELTRIEKQIQEFRDTDH